MKSRKALSQTQIILVAAVVVIIVASTGYFYLLPQWQEAQKPKIDKVYIGFLAPMTGQWAYCGDMNYRGVKIAVDEINAKGGIKSLGGAKIEIIQFDAGASSAECSAAYNRMIASGKKLSAVFLPWPSGYVVAVSELAEREKIPLMHTAWTEGPHQRGFKYIFRNTVNSTKMNNMMFPTILAAAEKGLGRPLQSVAFVYNDNPATLGLIATWREICNQKGIKLVLDEMYTSPLRDATPIMLKVQAQKPDIYVTYTGGVAEEVLMWTAAKDLGILGKIAMFTYTGANPITTKALGALTEGVFALTDWNMMKGRTEALRDLYVKSDQKYPDFDFLPKDTGLAYGVIWTLKEALEKSADPDPTAVRNALAAIDIKEGPATVLFGRVRYSARGEIQDSTAFIFQWQGKYPNVWPETVYPTEYATSTMQWPKP